VLCIIINIGMIDVIRKEFWIMTNIRGLNFLRIQRMAGAFQESKIPMIANELDLFSEVSGRWCSADNLALN
jgi:hypothetical protein